MDGSSTNLVGVAASEDVLLLLLPWPPLLPCCRAVLGGGVLTGGERGILSRSVALILGASLENMRVAKEELESGEEGGEVVARVLDLCEDLILL